MLKALKRGSAAVLASLALIVSTTLTASALTYNPNPIHSGDRVTVVSSSSDLPSGHYKISVCTTKGFGLLGVPACATGADLPDFEGGRLTATLAPISQKDNPNAHAKHKILWGQPATFSCLKPGDCEILIVKHNVMSHEVKERTPITILP